MFRRPYALWVQVDVVDSMDVVDLMDVGDLVGQPIGTATVRERMGLQPNHCTFPSARLNPQPGARALWRC
jgi:hypothetical protein